MSELRDEEPSMLYSYCVLAKCRVVQWWLLLPQPHRAAAPAFHEDIACSSRALHT